MNARPAVTDASRTAYPAVESGLGGSRAMDNLGVLWESGVHADKFWAAIVGPDDDTRARRVTADDPIDAAGTFA